MANQYTNNCVNKDLPRKLYHYTSISTFYSIIKNKELWAFKTNLMNDETDSEFYITQLQNETRTELKNIIEIERHTSFFNKLLTFKQSNYVICFSKLSDDAGLWERYADKATGICIIFDTKYLHNLVSKDHFLLNTVYYKNTAKEHAHYQHCLDFFRTGITPEYSENGLISAILAYSTILKHSGFATEHEIRFTSLEGIPPKNCTKKIEFINDQERDVLKLNLEKSCKDSNISIEKIITHISIGPRSKQSIPALSQFLKDNGFPKLADNVSQSSCPLR